MAKPLSELTDQELLTVAAGYPTLPELTDDQLLAVAVHQGRLQPEEAGMLLRKKKAAERAPVAEAVAQAMSTANPWVSIPAPVTRALLKSGGLPGDIAAGVLPPIAGSLAGALGGLPGVAAGGAVGGATGEGLVQARQYFRGERDDLGVGRLAGATIASAIPLGGQVPRLAQNMLRRGAQGAAISAGAELAGQTIDEGEIDLARLAASGALGFLFGGAAGTAENLVLRRTILDQIRRTPEFAGFKGSDAELVDAVRARIASAAPEPRNVTPDAPPAAPALPDAPASAAPAESPSTGPIVPTAEQQFSQLAGLEPRVIVPPTELPPSGDPAETAVPSGSDNLPQTEPPAAPPPLSSLSDAQLVALAEQSAPAAPEPQSPAAPAGIEVPSSGPAADATGTPPATVGQAEQSVPTATPQVTPEVPAGWRSVRIYDDPSLAAQEQLAALAKGKRMMVRQLPDGRAELLYKPKGRGFKIGPPPDGDSDILNDIAELGGIAAPKSKDATGYDGFAEAFGVGPARLLRRRGAQSPDALVDELNSLGARDNSERGRYNFQSIYDMYQAVINAVRQREKMASALRALKHEAKISEALFNNTGRASALNARKPVAADSLNVGDTFEVRGEPLKVIAIDPDTNNVIVRNGGEIVIPAGADVFPDKGRVKRAPKVVADEENMPFESARAYGAAHARYVQLRAAEKAGSLDAAGQAELDQVERTLGQDFLDFYSAEKQGAPTALASAAELQRAEIQRRADARLQASDLQNQLDLFGPTTDKAGQFSLFENTVARYLDARQLKTPAARAAVRGILAGVWERKLARQLELDLATDGALAATLDPASGRLANAPGQQGESGRMGRTVDPLPNAQLGAHAGGLQLEARLYTQAFLAEGFMQHIGRRFENVAELVSAAQVLRNRNVETFWVLPYDAEGRLLAPFAFSSRLPNTVNLGANYPERLNALLSRAAAVSYDVLHNHPSGQPTPSTADRLFTAALAKNVKGLGRHFIINHGTYSVLDARGDDLARNQALPWIASQPDPTVRPQGGNPYLGRKLTPTDALALGYELQVPFNNVTLFFLNAEAIVAATGSVSAVDLMAPGFPGALRELARGVGGVEIIAYYDGLPAITDRLQSLHTRGMLSEVIVASDRGVMREGRAKAASIYANSAQVATRVAEDSAYVDDAPAAPTLFVSEFDKTPVPQPLAQMPLVRAVEMPELVNLVKQLAGSVPRLRRIPKAHGYMTATGRGRITLDRRIFSDAVFAQQVLAHELGHLVDYFDDLTLERGNLLGRMASLRDFMRNSLPLDPDNPADPLTPKDRREIRRQAEIDIGPKPPRDAEDALNEWRQAVRVRYAELVQAALDARGLVVARGRTARNALTGEEATIKGLGDIEGELKNLSYWWRPLQPGAPESYYLYRNSAKEIYADALSVLFNAPKEFRDRAPTAWQMFFAYLDRKPEAKKEVVATWDLLHNGAQAVSAERLKNVRAGFARAEEILLAKAAERDARRNSLPAIIENFKQKHWNVYAPIIDRARQARAVRPLKWWEDPEFVFDAHPFAENANYRFLDRVQKTVLSPLEELGVDSDTLGDYLLFNRIAHESYMVGDKLAGRATIANPHGHTPQTARRELLVMRYRLGLARFEATQRAARLFQDLALEVVERGHAAGIYSDEQLALARENRYNYAAFAVVDYLEQSPHIPAAFRQQSGTLREVANPFLATLLKMMTANKFAELNHAKRVTVQLLANHFSDEVALAPVSKLPLAGGRVMFKPKAPPQGKRELVVMDQGRPITWHVEPEIADMFEHTPPAAAHAIIGVTNWVFRNIFYPAFITYNPAFQLYANPIRDLSRSYVKLPPGVKRRHWLGEQLRAHRGARARLLNDINGTELERRRQLRALAKRRPLDANERDELQLLDDRALAIEVLVLRGITTPFESFASNPMRDDVWGQMLADYRLAPSAPEHGAALRRWLDVVPGLGALLDKIEFAGQTAEAMPKLGAYRVLTRELGWTPEQAAYYVRNHVGTPNFTKKGRWTVWDGTVFPFINIFMRGLESDVQQARGRIPGVPIDPRAQKFSYWRRMAERTLIPRLLQALAAAGLLGGALKKYYDAWSDYNKANYLILPLGTVHDGKSEFGYKSVGLRIPEDETARMLGGIMHYIVQLAATQDDPAAKSSLANLVNFAGGQVPGVNPVITLTDGWVQYSSGLNPRDRLRGNPVLSDAKFKAGGWDALGGMVAWTWDEVGGGNFVRYDPQANTWQQHLIGGLPVLSRAVKITDAGLRERQQTLEAALDTRNAKIRLAMPENVNQLLAEYSRLTAIRRENRTPVQQARLAELSYWHSKVWTPNYEMMQDSEERTWKSQGEAVGQISKAFEKR